MAYNLDFKPQGVLLSLAAPSRLSGAAHSDTAGGLVWATLLRKVLQAEHRSPGLAAEQGWRGGSTGLAVMAQAHQIPVGSCGRCRV